MGCGGSSEVKEKEINSFLSIVIKLDTINGGWARTMTKILKTTKMEISKSRSDYNGIVEISGTVNPMLVFKVLAKFGDEVQVVSWQFGGCSRNLNINRYPPPPPYGAGGYAGYRYGGNNNYYGQNYPSNYNYNNYYRQQQMPSGAETYVYPTKVFPHVNYNGCYARSAD